jgi:hypothetical protein
VAEVLISFRLPPSMTQPELRAWIGQRARSGRPALALDGLQDPDGDRQLLRVDLRADSTEADEAQLSELMMDMRLLGLCPVVAPSPSRASRDRTN